MLIKIPGILFFKSLLLFSQNNITNVYLSNIYMLNHTIAPFQITSITTIEEAIGLPKGRLGFGSIEFHSIQNKDFDDKKISCISKLVYKSTFSAKYLYYNTGSYCSALSK